MLREYVKEGNLSGIEMYLDEIEDEYMYVPRKVWTGNGFLDFILSQKKSRAESKGIVFDIDSEIIPVWGLTDSEISVVFGNLLDNAIEASEKVHTCIYKKERGGCRGQDTKQYRKGAGQNKRKAGFRKRAARHTWLWVKKRETGNCQAGRIL